MKRPAPLAAVVGLTLALSVTGCTDPSVSATMKSIDSIGTVSIESKDAIDSANKQYDSLDKELKKEVENYDELKSANKRYDQLLYSEITKEISHSQEILSSYFAQQFDTKEIEAAKTDAQAALDASDTDGYYKVYKALKKADKELDTYIKDEKKKSYSMETYGGDNPFRLEESDLPSEWSFKPITLQSSTHPSWVMSEKKATDLPTYVYFFINQTSREYTYQLNQIPTKAIKVQDEDGKMQTALVNTEIRPSCQRRSQQRIKRTSRLFLCKGKRQRNRPRSPKLRWRRPLRSLYVWELNKVSSLLLKCHNHPKDLSAFLI